ncbi:MAG: hypothetical protein ACXWTL_08550 [Methylobacter sp.]
MTAAKLRLAMAAMGQPETTVGNLCKELGIIPGRLCIGMFPLTGSCDRME